MTTRNKPGKPLHSRSRFAFGTRPGPRSNKPPIVDIFLDRRQDNDRREQSLPIPQRMCRRREDRRKNTFNSRPWWLQVNYNDDFNHWI